MNIDRQRERSFACARGGAGSADVSTKARTRSQWAVRVRGYRAPARAAARGSCARAAASRRSTSAPPTNPPNHPTQPTHQPTNPALHVSLSWRITRITTITAREVHILAPLMTYSLPSSERAAVVSSESVSVPGRGPRAHRVGLSHNTYMSCAIVRVLLAIMAAAPASTQRPSSARRRRTQILPSV